MVCSLATAFPSWEGATPGRASPEIETRPYRPAPPPSREGRESQAPGLVAVSALRLRVARRLRGHGSAVVLSAVRLHVSGVAERDAAPALGIGCARVERFDC